MRNKYIYIYMWNKIVNPKTGRKVNVNSKIGKSVLRNYMKQLGGAQQGQRTFSGIQNARLSKMLRGHPYGANISFNAFLHPNRYTVHVEQDINNEGGFYVQSEDIGGVNTFLKALNSSDDYYERYLRNVVVE